MSDHVAVTVAICTRNRCDLLKQTLEGFTQLDAPEGAGWELVVVDNDSTDDTRAVLDAFVGRLPIRVLTESRAGLSSARNRALRETTGDFILWTDDDVLVDRRWLAEFVAAAGRYPEAAAFGGPIEPWFLRPPNVELLEAFPRLASGFCGLNHDLPAGPMPGRGPIFGANMGYNRRITAGLQFDPARGPIEAMPGGGDDVEFLRQICQRGGTVIWWPAMRVKHRVHQARTTLAYLRRFTSANGGERVLSEHLFDDRSSQLLGAPRWLWKAWTDAGRKYWVSRLGGRPVFPMKLWSGPVPKEDCSQRVYSLVWLRELMYLEGMLRQHRSGIP